MNRFALVLLLVGCGGGGQSPTDAGPGDGDPAPGVCGASGSGSVTGSIGGVEVSPVVRAHQFSIGVEGTVIVLDEVDAACGEAGATGEHLVLLFCAAPAVGTHPVVGEQAFACPSADAAGLVEVEGGGDFAEATAGSISISDADGTCTTGTFSIDLTPNVGSPGTLTGSFAAIVCP